MRQQFSRNIQGGAVLPSQNWPLWLKTLYYWTPSKMMSFACELNMKNGKQKPFQKELQ